jgi:hypothetical protein
MALAGEGKTHNDGKNSLFNMYIIHITDSFHGIRVSHPEIPISQCEPFSKRKSKFSKDFIYFNLK